jgi:biotin synthase
MCYAIPARIIEIHEHIAIVDYFGEQRRILLDDTTLAIGDYVYAQGGICVRKIPEEEAEEILETWKNIFFELKKVDETLSHVDAENLPENILDVLQKVNYRQALSHEEVEALMALRDPNELKVLYEVSNHVRQRIHGNASCVHGIIEFSNYCCNSCHYCGIRREHDIPRYRMPPEDIIAAARYAVETYDFKALVLQSGEDYGYDNITLAHVVREVRRLGVLVFVSIGLRDEETYQALYDAGARAALIRFESSNEELFAKMRPATTLSRRLELIHNVKKMGYIIATGFIVGLPGETPQDTVNNIFLTKSLQPDMYSFGPLIPTCGTPLEGYTSPSIEEILRITALVRCADPNCNIVVTTALETLSLNARKQGLLAGANSLMINLTPEKVKKLYAIYDNRAGVEDGVGKAVTSATDLLYSLGRAPTDIGVV